VNSVPTSGGTVRTLAKDLKAPVDVAVDATSVYVADNGADQVLRINK
jgi:hypothetical protein